MTEHYDALETREPARREAELFSRLPDLLRAAMAAPAYAERLKGMFVRPEQIAEIGKRHPDLGRLRLVVTRSGENDLMTLKVESAAPSETAQSELAAMLRAVTKLGGDVELVAAGSLPNDGKVIADER